MKWAAGGHGNIYIRCRYAKRRLGQIRDRVANVDPILRAINLFKIYIDTIGAAVCRYREQCPPLPYIVCVNTNEAILLNIGVRWSNGSDFGSLGSRLGFGAYQDIHLTQLAGRIEFVAQLAGSPSRQRDWWKRPPEEASQRLCRHVRSTWKVVRIADGQRRHRFAKFENRQMV